MSLTKHSYFKYSVEVEEEFTFPKDGARPSVDHPGDGKYKFMPLDIRREPELRKART